MLFTLLLLLRVFFMLSLTSSKALTYNELSSEPTLNLLFTILLLTISVLSSFLRIGLIRGTGFAFANATFDVTSTGFSKPLLFSTGLVCTFAFFNG